MYHLNLHIRGYFHLVATCELYNSSFRLEDIKSSYTNEQGEKILYVLPNGIYTIRLFVANQITDTTIILDRNLTYVFDVAVENNNEDVIFITPQLPITTRPFSERYLWLSDLYGNNESHSEEATMAFVISGLQGAANDYYRSDELMLLNANDLRAINLRINTPGEIENFDLLRRINFERPVDRIPDKVIHLSLPNGDYFLLLKQEGYYKMFPLTIASNEHHFCSFVYNKSILPESFRWLKHPKNRDSFHYTDFLLIDILCNQLLWESYTIKPSLVKHISRLGKSCHPTLRQLVKQMVQRNRQATNYKPKLITTLFANTFASEVTINFSDLKRMAVKYPALIKENSIEDIISEGLQFNSVFTSFRLNKSNLPKLAYAKSSLRKYRENNSGILFPLLMIFLKTLNLLFQKLVDFIAAADINRYQLKKIITSEDLAIYTMPSHASYIDDAEANYAGELSVQINTNWIWHMSAYMYTHNSKLKIGDIARELNIPSATVIHNLRRVAPGINNRISAIQSSKWRIKSLLIYFLFVLIFTYLIKLFTLFIITSNQPVPVTPSTSGRVQKVDSGSIPVKPPISLTDITNKRGAGKSILLLKMPSTHERSPFDYNPLIFSKVLHITDTEFRTLKITMPPAIIREDLTIHTPRPDYTYQRTDFISDYIKEKLKNNSPNNDPSEIPFLKKLWKKVKKLF